MKEKTLLDILVYLFETYVKEGSMVYTNPKLIGQDMIESGFAPKDVNTVLHWFNDLIDLSQIVSKENLGHVKVIRIYTREECEKISVAARNYLLYLERFGVVNMAIRELVINQALEMDTESIGIPEIKWIVFMILFKDPNYRRTQLQLLAILILDGNETIKH